MESPGPAPAECAIPAPVVLPDAHEPHAQRRLHRPLGLADALSWLAIVVVAINHLALAPPTMPRTGLDPGWQAALNHTFLHGSVFGRDIVFTFGPLGFLHLPMFDPALYGWCVLFGGALAIVVASNITVLARRARIPPVLAALWGIALVLMAGSDPDGRFYLLCLLAAWIGIDEHDRPSRLLLAANAAVLATVSLAKVSHGVGITLLVLLMSLRNGPLTAGVFVATVVALWVAAGQPLDGFPAYVQGSLQIMSGYSEINVEDGPVSEIITYVAIATALVTLLAMRASRSRGPWRWIALGYMALWLFIVFRHAFSLHLYHSLTGVMGLMIASLIAAGACWEWRRTPLEVGLILVALGAIGFTAGSRWHGIYAALFSPRALLAATVGNLPRLAGVANGWRDDRATWAAARERITDDHPMPPTVTGSVDVLGWQTAIPLAGELPWHPKPVIQQYLVGTPYLAALNAGHIASDGADTLLADVTTIGQRPPMLDTGPMLLEVIRHYTVAELPGEFVVLRRRDEPRAVELEPLGTMDVRLDQRITVPVVDAPLWVRIEVEPTLLGRIRGAVLKRPKLSLDVELADGSTRRFTIFPTMTRSGFLLSPVVLEANGLGAILTGNAEATSAYVVRALAVREAEPSGSYAEPFRLTFAALRFAPDPPPASLADTSVPLPLSVVEGAMNLRLRSDATGLTAEDVAPGAIIFLPAVAGSTRETRRWLELDVEVTHAEELRILSRRLNEPFTFERSVAFQLSPGRHSIRVPLLVSPVPVQVRIDPAARPGRFRILGAHLDGVDPLPARTPIVRMGDVTSQGLPGWYLPFRMRAPHGRPLVDSWGFQPVVATPAPGPSEPLPLAAATSFAGLVLKPGGAGTLTADYPQGGGGLMLGEIPALPRTPRVLELRARASTPTSIRLWWQTGKKGWDRARSVGVFVGPSPTIVHMPVPGGTDPTAVRLDVDPGATGTLQVSDVRLVQAPPPSDH